MGRSTLGKVKLELSSFELRYVGLYKQEENEKWCQWDKDTPSNRGTCVTWCGGEVFCSSSIFEKEFLWVTNDDSETDILAVVSSNFSSHSRFVHLFWARLIIFLFLLAMLCYCLLLSLCLTDGFYSVQSRLVITKRKVLRNIEMLECVQRMRKWIQYLLESLSLENSSSNELPNFSICYSASSVTALLDV